MIIGNLTLALALPFALYGVATSFMSVKNAYFHKQAKNITHFVTLLVTLASFMIIIAFLSDSFQIEYVAAYSSRSLPFVYKLTGIWAGLDGSLLFWLWLLVIFASINAYRSGDKEFGYVNAVLQIVVIFFLLMLVFEANPFTALSHPPVDGRGLNPLLQNFYMIFHPPALYVGYVGFTVPFAYAINALITKNEVDDEWIRTVRLWTIVSWLFLTIGNLLGAMWAYVELGWGGFWAWDPVENAGILPWFTATAFLHSIIMQEKRKMLKVWNLALIIATFLLTIFGTFITRSGIIESVHSFADATIGLYFIIFLALVTLVSAYLLISRRSFFVSKTRLDTIFSREGTFYINNILFLLSIVAILWGTLTPLFTEIFFGQKIEAGPAFFNRVMAPIGIALLFLTGIGPEMSWKKIRTGLFKREFLIPTIIMLASCVALFAFGVKKWFPLAAISGAIFVISTSLDEFIRSALLISKRQGQSFLNAFISLFGRAPRRYGGYVVHIGVAVLFIGIAGSSYQQESTFALKVGETKTVNGYEFRLDKFDWVQGLDNEGVIANVALSKGGSLLSILRPALFLHKNQPKPIAEIDLYIRPARDVYLVLGSLSKNEQEAEFKLTVTPLIIWVWVGGFIMIIGTLLAVLPRRGRKEIEQDISEEIELDIELNRADREDFDV